MTYISKSESVNFIVAYLQIDAGELFQLFKGLNKQQLPDICSDLKTAIPEPMNTMLEKEAQEMAIRKQVEHSSRVVKDVPCTIAGTYQNENLN